MRTPKKLGFLIPFLLFSASCEDEQTDATPNTFFNGIAVTTLEDFPYDIAVVSEKKEIVFIEEESPGIPKEMFYEHEGQHMYLQFEEGLPKIMEAAGTLVIFENFTENSVDIGIIEPDGTITTKRNLPWNGEGRDTNGRIARDVDDATIQTLITVGIGLEFVFCGVLIAASPPTGGLTALLAVASCTAGTISSVASLDDTDQAKLIKTSATATSVLIDTYGCATKNMRDCASLLQTLNEGSDDLSNAMDTFSDEVNLVEGALISGFGDVKFTLTWNNTADLDLHATDPLGETIYFASSSSNSGGKLDVDDTDGEGPENIFWPIGTAPKGTYLVEVDHYSGESPAGFSVLIDFFGEIAQFNGSISSGEKLVITNLTRGRVKGKMSGWTVSTVLSDKEKIK